MNSRIRYGNYLREVSLRQRSISYNDLNRLASRQSGTDQERVKLRSVDVARLIRPYLGLHLNDQIKAVVPLAAYLVLFQLFIIKSAIDDPWLIFSGLVGVIVGLMLFMEGLKVGLMPFGETIGNLLPSKASLPLVLIIAFLLGIGVTFAEPAIGALKTAGANVDVHTAPYLYALLNDWSGVLVLVVGMGVGLAAVLGTLRFLYNLSLKPLIYATLAPILLLTLWFMNDPHLTAVLGLAWDSGAVTTGPVTVPLVLSLGVGIAASAGKGGSSLDGFGIVTLASLFPIIGVMLLSLYLVATVPVEALIANAGLIRDSGPLSWTALSPWAEILGGMRAIVPLVLFLLLVLYGVLREKVRERLHTGYGIVLCVLGMVIFNLGLTYGLSRLGEQSGSLVPGAFAMIEAIDSSPLFTYGFGIFVAALFAWILGLGATLAEPALNALGATVAHLTNGAFKQSMLMYAVSIGVAFGIALGVLKLIYGIPLAWLVLPGYVLAGLLTALSTEEFVNIAWDSAGVTTGPVTVPLVLAMGLGFGNAVGAADGFGILSMASICPIIAVLGTGQWVQWGIRRRHRLAYAPDPETVNVEPAV